MKPSIALSLLLLVAPASAQLISATTAPNPAKVGDAIGLTIEASGPVTLDSGCGFTKVHQGSPSGPVVFNAVICPKILIIVGPGGSKTVTWQGIDDQGNPVPPGTYYLRVDGKNATTNAAVAPAFFPVRIDTIVSLEPVLTLAQPATLGTTLPFSISAPTAPSSTYFLGASFTTNVGLQLPGLHVALDNDALFGLSLPVPSPAFFSSFVGALDPNGQTSLPMATLPKIAALRGFPIAFQALVIDGSGFHLTNPITRTLQ